MYHVMNVTSIEAELFAIRWSINCITQMQDIVHIICYELKSLELDKRTNSYIGVNTRELNRELFTK